MSKLLLSILLVPVIYVAIAIVLVMLPVKREPAATGLNFDKLQVNYDEPLVVATSYYPTRDGSSLFYRVLKGNDQLVVVLLHGSGTEGRYLLSLANSLQQNSGATVVIPDLRGHGESALEAMGDVNYLGQLSDDIDDLYQHLKGLYPAAKMILSGHSSGGGLALRYGGESQQRFDGYLLLAPYLGYQAPTVRPHSGGWVQVASIRYAGLAMLNNIGFRGFNDKSVLFFNRPAEWDGPLQVDHYSYRLNQSFAPQNYADDLAANDAPMLVLVGSDDEAFYADKFVSVFAEAGSAAKVRLIQGAQHLDMPSKEETAMLANEWLKSIVDKPL